MLEKELGKLEENRVLVGLIFFLLFAFFIWFNLETFWLLVVVVVMLTFYYIKNLVLIFRNYKKPHRLFGYKVLDLLFNATLFYSLYLGIYFSSKSQYFYLFSDKFTLFTIIKLAIILMYAIFLVKKFYIHMPLEYNLLFKNNDIWQKIIFRVLPGLWLLVLVFTKTFENLDYSKITIIYEIVFVSPLLLFIFATYLDLISFFNKKLAFEVRLAIHFIDLTIVYIVVNIGNKFVIPNLAINQSLTLPFIYIIPFIYLMHQIREYVLAYAIKNSKKWKEHQKF